MKLGKIGDFIAIGAQVLEESSVVDALPVGGSEQLPPIKTHIGNKSVQFDIKATVLADLSAPIKANT
jgi:hypothetical protein